MAKISKVIHSITIRKPIEEVFQFVTTPANWPKWHPASVGVEGAVDHSGKPGERMIEKIRLGPFKAEIHWEVIESQKPQRWLIKGEVHAPFLSGTKMEIIYQLSSQHQETQFERNMSYIPGTLIASLLDKLFIQRHNHHQSKVGLKQIKKILELN